MARGSLSPHKRISRSEINVCTEGGHRLTEEGGKEVSSGYAVHCVTTLHMSDHATQHMVSVKD